MLCWGAGELRPTLVKCVSFCRMYYTMLHGLLWPRGLWCRNWEPRKQHFEEHPLLFSVLPKQSLMSLPHLPLIFHEHLKPSIHRAAAALSISLKSAMAVDKMEDVSEVIPLDCKLCLSFLRHNYYYIIRRCLHTVAG